MEENTEDIEVIKNSIIIFALDNLSNAYEIALEDNQIKSEEQIEYAQFIIETCKMLIQEYSVKIPEIPHNIQRPKWKTK